jgi:hypothetical protein
MEKKRMKRVQRLGLVLLAVMMLAVGLAAAPLVLQSTERPRQVLSAGGHSVSVGSVTLRATLGQPFVGVNSSGGVSLGHGFWHGGALGPLAVYLPLVISND